MFQFRQRGQSGVDPSTEDLAEQVIGALIEVHRHLGPGMPEVSYRRAVSHELHLRQIEHVCEAPVSIFYKAKLVGEGRIDILVRERLVLELKAIDRLAEVHRAQVLSYLQAAGLQLGILVNFNVAVLKDGIKRIINTYQR